MVATATPNEARRFAWIALGLFLLDRLITSFIFILRPGVPLLQRIPAIPIEGILFMWLLPFVIVYRVERRDWRSLGLLVKRQRYLRYAAYALAGAVLPAVFVGVDASLLADFAEQLLYIGVAEELFWRGYLLRRLCDWLGSTRGLVLCALLFGLSHVVSLVSQHGFRYPLQDAGVFAQTFLGGLLLGFIYLRARNIVPGSIFHACTNVYLSRFVELLSG